MDQHITASVGRIVGNPVPGWWAQTLVYDPPFPDQRATRGTLYAVLDVAGNRDFDAVAAGKATINEFQDAYYRTSEGSVFVALEGAFQNAWRKLSEHLTERQTDEEVEVNMAAAVRWGTYWYVAASGTARVALLRNGELGTLIIGEKTARGVGTSPVVESASGEVLQGDYLIIATNAFCRVIQSDELRTLLTENPAEAVDALAPSVHGQEGTARVAGIIVHVTTAVVPAPDEEGLEFVNDDAPQPKGQTWPQRPVYLHTEDHHRSLWPLFIGIGSLLLLAGSAVFFKQSLLPSSGKLTSQEQEMFEQAQQRVEEAKALADLNITRSRTLLHEAKERLDSLSPQQKERKEVKALLEDMEAQRAATSRSYSGEPETYYTFSLIAQGATITDVSFHEGQLVAVNKDTKAVYKVDIAKKSATVVAGGESGPAQTDWVVPGSGGVYGVSVTNGIVRAEENGAKEMVKPDGTWSNAVDAEGYGGNVYVLDAGNKQIWKYVPVASGLSPARRYLANTPEELAEAVNFTIDGSVWVLTRRGEILKYLNGQKEQFAFKGLEQPLTSPTRLFTNEGQKLIYILDYGNQRVVAVTKEGAYHSDYKTSKVAQAVGLYADEKEKRLILVTKEALFSLPLSL